MCTKDACDQYLLVIVKQNYILSEFSCQLCVSHLSLTTPNYAGHGLNGQEDCRAEEEEGGKQTSRSHCQEGQHKT